MATGEIAPIDLAPDVRYALGQSLYSQSVLIDGEVTNQGENSQNMFSEFCVVFFCFIALRGHSCYRVNLALVGV